MGLFKRRRSGPAESPRKKWTRADVDDLRAHLVASLLPGELIRNEGPCHWVAERGSSAETTPTAIPGHTTSATPGYTLVCDQRSLVRVISGEMHELVHKDISGLLRGRLTGGGHSVRIVLDGRQPEDFLFGEREDLARSVIDMAKFHYPSMRGAVAGLRRFELFCAREVHDADSCPLCLHPFQERVPHGAQCSFCRRIFTDQGHTPEVESDGREYILVKTASTIFDITLRDEGAVALGHRDARCWFTGTPGSDLPALLPDPIIDQAGEYEKRLSEPQQRGAGSLAAQMKRARAPREPQMADRVAALAVLRAVPRLDRAMLNDLFSNAISRWHAGVAIIGGGLPPGVSVGEHGLRSDFIATRDRAARISQSSYGAGIPPILEELGLAFQQTAAGVGLDEEQAGGGGAAAWTAGLAAATHPFLPRDDVALMLAPWNSAFGVNDGPDSVTENLALIAARIAALKDPSRRRAPNAITSAQMLYDAATPWMRAATDAQEIDEWAGLGVELARLRTDEVTKG